jgi:hypothetical protein
MNTGADRRLAIADRLLNEPTLVEAGAWPKACTWLIRLALEHALDDYWAQRRPEIGKASRRAQLLLLSRTVDPDLGRRGTELWHVLSRAAHHHAYELSPTGHELQAWHRDVLRFSEDLFLKLDAADGGRAREDRRLDRT